MALHLAKMNQGEKGTTIVLERRPSGVPGAGLLVPHPDSERILASIQGDSAVLRLTLRDKVLMAIAEADGLNHVDQAAAAKNLWPDAANPLGQWQKQLTELRHRKLLADPVLTMAGLAHAQTLGFNSGRKTGGDTQPEIIQQFCPLPAGSGEME